MARRHRRFMRAGHRRRPLARLRASGSRVLTRIRRFGGRITHGLPSWAKPSKIIAYTGIGTAVIQLLFTPLSTNNGANIDSWLARLRSGWSVYESTKNPFDILGWDDYGNSAVSILAYQLQQNALPAAGTLVGFGVASAVVSYFGM